MEEHLEAHVRVFGDDVDVPEAHIAHGGPAQRVGRLGDQAMAGDHARQLPQRVDAVQRAQRRDQSPVVGVEQDRRLEDVQLAIRVAQDVVGERRQVATMQTRVGVADRDDQVVGIEPAGLDQLVLDAARGPGEVRGFTSDFTLQVRMVGGEEVLKQRREARAQARRPAARDGVAFLERQHHCDPIQRHVLEGEIVQRVGDDLLAFAAGRHDDQVAQLVVAGQNARGGDPVALLRLVQTPEADEHATRKGKRLPQPVDAEQDHAEAERGGGDEGRPDGRGDDQPDRGGWDDFQQPGKSNSGN